LIKERYYSYFLFVAQNSITEYAEGGKQVATDRSHRSKYKMNAKIYREKKRKNNNQRKKKEKKVTLGDPSAVSLLV
jgi:hypothetical protein